MGASLDRPTAFPGLPQSERGGLDFFFRLGARIGHLVLAAPVVTVVVSAAAVVALAFGVTRAELSADYRVFFASDDAEVKALENLELTFGKTDNIVFVVRDTSGNVFTRDALGALQELTARAWQIPHVARVDSLPAFPHSSLKDDEIVVEDLAAAPAETLSDGALAGIAAAAAAEPLLQGSLLGPRGDAAGVNVSLRLPASSPEAVAESAQAARTLLAEVKAKHPALDVRLSGLAMMNEALMEASVQDLVKMIPVTVAVMLMLMALLFRSAWATGCVVALIGMSAAAAMGFGGWAGYPFTPPASAAAIIVMTLCIADGVHIYQSARRALGEGLPQRAALQQAIAINLKAVMLTSVTSCVGFLALNFSESPPFHHLANMTTVGIVAALLLSVTFLPAALSLRPLPPARPSQNRLAPLLRLLGRHRAPTLPHGAAATHRGGGVWWVPLTAFIETHRQGVLAAGLGLAALAVPGAVLLESNDQFVEYFDEDVPFRRDTELMIAHLGGLYVLNWAVPAPEGVTEPEHLRILDGFARWLREQPQVTHALAVSDIIKRLHHLTREGGDTTALPASREAAAQLLLLYEMSLPADRPLSDRVAIDKSQSRVSAIVGNISSREMRELAARSDAWLREHAPPAMQVPALAPVVVFSHLSHRNARGMMLGNVITLVLISLSLMALLGSVRLGLLSLVPNVLPILFAYGVWYLLIGQINIVATIAGSVCLGLIVDDTIHFLTKYGYATRRLRLDRRAAVELAFAHAGNAIVATSVILAAGFAVLSTSRFQMNSYFGALVVIVVAAGLLADVVFLPATLFLFDSGPPALRDARRSSFPGAPPLSRRTQA